MPCSLHNSDRTVNVIVTVFIRAVRVTNEIADAHIDPSTAPSTLRCRKHASQPGDRRSIKCACKLRAYSMTATDQILYTNTHTGNNINNNNARVACQVK